VLAVIALQKTCIAGGNDLVAGQGARATLARLCDVSRHARVAADFLVTFVRCTAPAVVVVPIAFLVLGVAKDRSPRGCSTALMVFALMAAGYYLVCVTTPNGLDWQLDATHRLAMQIWPLCLLGLFALLGSGRDSLSIGAAKPHEGFGV